MGYNEYKKVDYGLDRPTNNGAPVTVKMLKIAGDVYDILTFEHKKKLELVESKSS